MDTIQKLGINNFIELIASLDTKPFRHKQIIEWLYCKGANSFNDMKNIPQSLKLNLSKNYNCTPSKIISTKTSSDGSTKHIIRLCDNNLIECVAIPAKGHKNKLTACISSQVGCSMSCNFCATGQLGYIRNLGFGEIIEQVLLIEKKHKCKVSNIVVMGQGEPFLNYSNVIAGLNILNTYKPYEIGSRKICISSCGLIAGIKKLSNLSKQYRLAISLHSADQKTRNVIMPRLKKQNIKLLKNTLIDYQKKTDRRISIEYIMIKNINDTKEQLDALYNFLYGIKAHINLIPYNKVEGINYEPSKQKTILYWVDFFKSTRIGINIRQSKGTEVYGACGQLANKK